jgi:hypothetical protein
MTTRLFSSRRMWALALLALPAALSACGSGHTLSTNGPSGGPTSGGVTLAQIQQQIFTPLCASCHTQGGVGPMSLSDVATSYASLVGADPTNSTAKGAGMKRVVAGNPSRSFLLSKLSGDMQFGEGDRMPQNANPLSAQQITLIRQWIQEGAPRDGSGGGAGNPGVPGPGIITTLAGDGSAGYEGDGVPLSQAHLYWPQDVFVDPSGQIYILDWNNHRVRMAALPNGIINTVIGSGFLGDGTSGPATGINLNHPTDLTMDSQGRLVLAAWHNWKIKRVNADGNVEVLAGTSQGFSGDGGPANKAQMDLPSSAEYDAAGNLYISDQGNRRIRKVDPSGIITTFAGTGVPGFAGDGGPASAAQFNTVRGSDAVPCFKLTIDGQTLYVADTLNNRVRAIDLGSGIIRTVAGNGAAVYAGDGGPAANASLNFPTDVAVGPDHSLYICDSRNHSVRRVGPDGTISTVAGSGVKGFGGDRGPATAAKLNTPGGIFVDPSGTLYIADTLNQRIRTVKLPS